MAWLHLYTMCALHVSTNMQLRTCSGMYAAPEILHNVKRRYDGKPADVWSTGVVLFAMLFCQYPFDRRHGDPALHSREYQKLFIERLKHADIV